MLIFRDLTSGRAVRVNNKHDDVIARLEKMGWARQPDVDDVNIATVETVEELKRYDASTTGAAVEAPPAVPRRPATKPAPKAKAQK